MLTSRGWSLIGATAGLYAGARILGLVELMMLATAGAVLLFWSIIATRGATTNLRIERIVQPLRPQVGGEAVVRLAISNIGSSRTPLLTATEIFGEGTTTGGPTGAGARAKGGGSRAARFVVAPIKPGETTSGAYRFPARQRGRYRLGPLVVEVGDPFGLTQRRCALIPAQDLLVYPRIRTIAPIPETPDPHATSTSTSRIIGPTGADFRGLRDYVHGDELRRVHWRSTARRDEIMIRVDEIPRRRDLTILLDTRNARHSGESFEVAVEVVASIAATSTGRETHDLTVLTTGGDRLSRQGRGQKTSLMDALAVIETDERNNVSKVAASLRRRHRSGALVIVTGEFTGPELKMLRGFKSAYETLIVIQTLESELGRSRAKRSVIGPRVSVVHIATGAALPKVWNEVLRACRQTDSLRSPHLSR